MSCENCLVVFNLGHLDNSVGGVLFFILRNILPSECRKIVSAYKTVRCKPVLHATNGVVKMTQIKDYKAILTSNFFYFL